MYGKTYLRSKPSKEIESSENWGWKPYSNYPVQLNRLNSGSNSRSLLPAWMRISLYSTVITLTPKHMDAYGISQHDPVVIILFNSNEWKYMECDFGEVRPKGSLGNSHMKIGIATAVNWFRLSIFSIWMNASAIRNIKELRSIRVTRSDPSK